MAAPDPTAPAAPPPAAAAPTAGGRRVATVNGGLVAGWAGLTGLLLLCGTWIAGSAAVAAADRSITAWVVAHRSPGLDRAMRALTVTGSWVAALALAVVVALLARSGRIRGGALVTVLAGWGGEVAAVQLTKVVVRRPRPPDAVRLVPTHGWAFPSGHTATAVVVFATAAALVRLLAHRRWVRNTAPPVAAAVVGLVAFSRVELGAHWATDVAAATVWTAAWLVAAGAGAGRLARAAPSRELVVRRWQARLSLASVAATLVVLLAVGGRRGLGLALLTGVAAVGTMVAGFWFLRSRGRRRWLMGALAVGVPVGLLVLFVVERQLWVAVLAAGLLGAAVQTAHLALRPPREEWELPVTEADAPRHPFLVMNPRSGGGTVERFSLVARAEALGAEVAVIDGPAVDVRALAEEALSRGADLLGAAGGDGTQALVAHVAADHDVPFLVIVAGTRNHFARDLGLDPDPVRCLDALADGVEARLDLGDAGGRPFVNNASFGAYAEIVSDPGYRGNKRGTTLDALPDLLDGARGAHLRASADGTVLDGPQALLVSNNPYEDGDLAGLGRRARLDRGVLGVIAVRVDRPRQAVGLLNHASVRGLRRGEAREVVVHADGPTIPVGIDGEAARLPTPVRCTIRPGVLRVRLPRTRPGIRPPAGRWDWPALWRLAAGRPVAAPGLGSAPRQDQPEDGRPVDGVEQRIPQPRGEGGTHDHHGPGHSDRDQPAPG